MAILTWDAAAERIYETGVSKGVLYPTLSSGKFTGGVAWNGLTAVNENPSGAEPTDLWADNMKYLSIRSAEEFGFTIEAYTYPDEFAECDGSKEIGTGVKIGQQTRKSFGFCYQTIKGNDEQDNDYGYLIHIVYNCTCSPSAKNYSTVNDSPEAITFSWEVETTPQTITTKDSNNKPYKPSATVTIDSTAVNATKLATIEGKLYGTASAEPELPTIDELITILSAT